MSKRTAALWLPLLLALPASAHASNRGAFAATTDAVADQSNSPMDETKPPSDRAIAAAEPAGLPADQAAEPVDQPAPPPPNKWQFATVGYIWFAGAWGKTDVIGPLPPVDLALPFGKVLKGFK